MLRRARTVQPHRRLTATVAALCAFAATLTIALAPAPARSQSGDLPWFEHARVDLEVTGSTERTNTAPPPEEHADDGHLAVDGPVLQPEGRADGKADDGATDAGQPDDGFADTDADADAGAEADPEPVAPTEETPTEETPDEGHDDHDEGHDDHDEPAPGDGPRPGWSTVADLPIDGQFVVLEWQGDPHVDFAVRSRNEGTWSEWVTAHVDGDEAPDPGAEPGAATQSVGPIFVGEGAEQVEVVVREGQPDDLSLLVMESHEPDDWVDPVTTGASAPAGRDAVGRAANGQPAAPVIKTRAQWGAGGWAYGNSGCSGGPTVASSLRFAVIHHTVSTNSYSQSQADDQIRAIYDYHVNSRGWCDIAYNFVVDKYGTVWEGRTNSTNQTVQGGHASGFNSGSVGVVLLGQYHPGATPTPATVSSAQFDGVAALLAWKFGQHGIDPKGTTVEISGGSSSIPSGQKVTLNTISGHRNVGATGCPGDYAYVRLPEWRNEVAARVATAPNQPSRPAAGVNADGRMEVWAVDSNDQIRLGYQSVPNGGPWNGWYTLDAMRVAGGVSAAQNLDGRMELFARQSNGRIQHAWQTTPNGIWSDFESLGGSAIADPAAGRNADGRLEAYYTGSNGQIYHNWQWKPGGLWSGWHSLGGVFVNAPAVGMNADGRQEVAVVGLDGQLFHSWQWVPNGGWSGWFPMGGKLKGDPAVATNADGRLEMFAIGADGQLWHNWQWGPNGSKGWSGWLPMGGSWNSGGPAVTRNIDGRLELVIYGDDGRLWHNWQVVANGGWSGWHPLSEKLR